ncbi:hypothetical protein SARC_12714 [Sphaeroforma arctica JP610]|uniref:Transmembrane protein 106 C-terminal domain-containing protein n=1 Tax=Sphaeroforma arctica JP610 TaxID=667725 RepID=A0A0L0FE52_9EUKA|nr:hypothetical protein SARC_12714 [Sphaeroforma arctica JP610]KNC74746.1 hypothetical protein SARC_12714 [Sphaeroforma arctica JP610]|eukprot:XP_014148648.1 hypothetical protein SARC_12714 [Sphaeroforma arctica JP610]
MTYSREIETLSSYIPPEPPSAPGEKNVNVTLQDHITVTNNNFLAASVSSIELEVFYRGSFSGRAVVRNMIVPARDKLDVDVTVNVDQLTRDSARSMFKNCIFFPQMERLDFRMNVTVTVLSQNQNMFRKFSAFVDCKNTTEEEVFTYPRIPNFAQFGIDHT